MPVAFGTPGTPASTGQSHRIDVWIFDLDRPGSELPGLTKLLSPGERHRRSSFKQPMLADRWTVAHARLRQILGSYLGTASYDDEFVLNSYGKPRVRQGPLAQALHFNLAHSGQVCGVAVCLTGDIGLDIETIDMPPWEIEPDVFNEREREELASHTGFERQLAFYRGWTRKEAVIKAMGLGLSFPLHDLDVDLAQTQTRLRRLASDQDPCWTLAGLEEASRWVGAVAMQTSGGAIQVQFRDTSSHFGT